MSNIISFFQKLIKGGVGIRAGGLENFSKINKRGGRLFGTREYPNKAAKSVDMIPFTLLASLLHLRTLVQNTKWRRYLAQLTEIH